MGLHSPISILFDRSIQYGCLFSNKTFLFPFYLVCFVCVYYSLAVEDYSNCELMGGGFPTNLNNCYNFLFIISVLNIKLMVFMAWLCLSNLINKTFF